MSPAVTYTKLGDKTPVTLGACFYREFNADHRSEGNSTTVSGTVKFQAALLTM